MRPLPISATDRQFIDVVDDWVRLLECEDYLGAYQFTKQDVDMAWTADLMREVIKAYGECLSTQRVTLVGRPTDVSQRKEVTRFEDPRAGHLGYIWYDLNIDGVVSDLTATFDLEAGPEGISLVLNDIHVM